MRAELTDLERANYTARRAEIVRQRTEFAKLAKTTPSAERAEKGQGHFEKQTAEATGRSVRGVQRDKARGEKIAGDVMDAIRSTPAANKGVELDALAGMSHDEQHQAVERVESGASENFREARDFIQGDEADRAQDISIRMWGEPITRRGSNGTGQWDRRARIEKTRHDNFTLAISSLLGSVLFLERLELPYLPPDDIKKAGADLREAIKHIAGLQKRFNKAYR